MTAVSGNALLVAGAKASVPLARLPDVLDAAETEVDESRVRRECECVHDADEKIYLAERGFWTTVAERAGLSAREADAVRRAHEEHFRSVGRRENRTAEFETALELREAVVL